jgi:hypothetical protein
MAKTLKSRSATSKATKQKPQLSDLKQVLLGADEDHKSNSAGNDSAESGYSSNSNSMMNAPDSRIPDSSFSSAREPKNYQAPASIPLDKSALGSAKASKSWAKTSVDSKYTTPYPKETPLRDLKAPDVVNQSKVNDPISSLENMKAPGPKNSNYYDIRDNSNTASKKNFEAYSNPDLDPSKNSSIVKNKTSESLGNSNPSVTQQFYKENSGKIGNGDFSDISKGNSDFKNIKDSAVKNSSPQIASSSFDRDLGATQSTNAKMPELAKESPGGDPIKGSVEPLKAKDDYTSKLSSKTKESVMSPINQSGLSQARGLSINVFK